MQKKVFQFFAVLSLIQIVFTGITTASGDDDTDGIVDLEKLATQISQQFA